VFLLGALTGVGRRRGHRGGPSWSGAGATGS
jgi:hypothetical protein